MSRHVNGELWRTHPTVLYLCDGKVPRCSGSFYCLTECKHTTDLRYAKNFDYGEAEFWEKEEGDERGEQMGTEDQS